jgi:CRP-like cAMP-binding protein
LLQALIAKLERRQRLNDGIVEGIERHFSRRREFDAGQELANRAGLPLPFSYIQEGWAARYKILANGRRQITGILMAGDFVDLQRLGVSSAPNNIVALTHCRLAASEFHSIDALEERHPPLAACLWAEGMVEHAMLQEWLVAMGRRSAMSRMAHLLCELFIRQSVIRETAGPDFRVPLTQTDLADVLGLSIVHVHRVLRMLRNEKAAAWTSQTISVVDWSRLRELAEFNPCYLGYAFETIVPAGTIPVPET